jgi:hypothetical protein
MGEAKNSEAVEALSGAGKAVTPSTGFPIWQKHRADTTAGPLAKLRRLSNSCLSRFSWSRRVRTGFTSKGCNDNHEI